MRASDSYGQQFADRLHAVASGTHVQTLKNSMIAVTEVRGDNPEHRLSTPPMAEDAFQVALQLRAYPTHDLWIDGKALRSTRYGAGETTIYDLRRPQTFHIKSPFHSVHFYLPRTAMNAIADDAGVPRVAELRFTPGAGIDDPVLRSLTAALLPTFRRVEQANRVFVEHITLAAAAHIAQTYGEVTWDRRLPPGALAPWQRRRAEELLAANLDGEVSLAEIARQCGLSVGHFTRAFHRSTGLPPHRWLLKQRVEAAKAMLRSSERSLSDVALACGFADQSHFTRVFTRWTGVSPGAWRRAGRH